MAAATTREREVLREFLVEVGAYISGQPHEPAPGSPADLLGHPERALHAYQIGLTLADSAGEHASLLLDALDQPVKLLAACSCARVVLELSARVSWLLDPELEPAERHARIYGHRYSGIKQNMNFQRSEKQPVERHAARVEELAEEAVQLGVRVTHKRNGRVNNIGKRPDATSLVSRLKGASLYRILSAALHGHDWAIRRLAWRPEGHTRVGDTPVTVFDKVSRPNQLANLVAIVALDLASATSALVDYMGWNADQWRAIRNRLVSGLRVQQLVAVADRRHGRGVVPPTPPSKVEDLGVEPIYLVHVSGKPVTLLFSRDGEYTQEGARQIRDILRGLTLEHGELPRSWREELDRLLKVDPRTRTPE